MGLQSAVVGTAAVAITAAAAAAQNASYSSLGSVQILTANDLEQQLDINAGAILLGTPRDASAQASLCKQLGETLWSPETNDGFGRSLDASLSYLQYTGQYSARQKFHVAGGGGGGGENDGRKCRCVDVTGHIDSVGCETKLPALCTNSAPLSNITYGDRGEQWRFVQKVGNQELMGWRDQHTFKFQGVRYAEPVERYEYSVPRDMSVAEEGGVVVVDATNYGSNCWQPVGEVTKDMSEDCLFANIWTTYLPSAGTEEVGGVVERKAVMVNIHGGAFVTGTGANPNFDGTNLASRGDVVVVNLNYRLGNLGNVPFTDGVHNGNYGLGDLVTALRWIRDNIEYFGGDPEKVTIFGQSAGACAVRALMSSTKAKGLFRGGIEQSCPSGWDLPGVWDWTTYRTPELVANMTTTRIVEEAGCPAGTGSEALQCLRGVDPEKLVNLATLARFPIKDGNILTVQSLELTPDSTAKDVNLITGTNRNEAGILIPYPDPTPDFNGTEWALFTMTSQLSNVNQSFFVPYVDFLLPANASLDSAYNITEHLMDLGTFDCKSYAIIHSATLHDAVKNIWVYQFNRTYSPFGYTTKWCSAPVTTAFPNGDPSMEYYKCHGGEQYYVWGNMIRSGESDRDGKDSVLMRTVVDYWSSFGRTGDPNPDPAYLTARRYQETKMVMENSGTWEPASKSDPGTTRRVIEYPITTQEFPEEDVCTYLKLPLDFLEKN